MLGDKQALATVAVKDIATARKFYGGSLGLEEVPTDEPEVLSYRSGNGTIVVYRSEYAGTNQATAVTWMVGPDVGDIVRSLKEKGVVFEHYDFPGVTREGDVHVSGKLRVAWFKDPDGNIHSLANG